MNKERRLGRGLEALLGRPADSYAPREVAASSPAAAPVEGGLVNVSVYEIDRNPYQPRRDFDDAELGSLADSIQEHGLLQPIVVRRQGERFQLVAGERRLRAAIKAGLGEVAVQVRDVDDRLAAEIAIVENLQRKDLNALEKRLVSRVPRALRLHAGRAGQAFEDRPLDRGEPDPPSGAARRRAIGAAPARLARGMLARYWHSTTNTSRSSSARASSAKG